MLFRNSAVLGLLFVAACASDSVDPTAKNVGGGGGEGEARLEGRILGFTAPPDSTQVSVAGAEVTLVLIGAIPVDTSGLPPDSLPPIPPGDTMLWMRRALVSLQLDTIITPPDTTPPPPPVFGCDRPGDTVTTVASGALGTFVVEGLAEGVYDIAVTSPVGSGFGGSYYCGLPLRAGSSREINIYVPRAP